MAKTELKKSTQVIKPTSEETAAADQLNRTSGITEGPITNPYPYGMHVTVTPAPGWQFRDGDVYADGFLMGTNAKAAVKVPWSLAAGALRVLMEQDPESRADVFRALGLPVCIAGTLNCSYDEDPEVHLLDTSMQRCPRCQVMLESS